MAPADCIWGGVCPTTELGGCFQTSSEVEARFYKSTNTATMVGGPQEFVETKGCNCFFEGGTKGYYCNIGDLD